MRDLPSHTVEKLKSMGVKIHDRTMMLTKLRSEVQSIWYVLWDKNVFSENWIAGGLSAATCVIFFDEKIFEFQTKFLCIFFEWTLDLTFENHTYFCHHSWPNREKPRQLVPCTAPRTQSKHNSVLRNSYFPQMLSNTWPMWILVRSCSKLEILDRRARPQKNSEFITPWTHTTTFKIKNENNRPYLIVTSDRVRDTLQHEIINNFESSPKNTPNLRFLISETKYWRQTQSSGYFQPIFFKRFDTNKKSHHHTLSSL